MIPIKVEKFARMYLKSNKDENLHDVIDRLNEALKRKKAGVKCSQCKTRSIWAIGSALGGFEGCFNCITGEADDSEDYEVF